MSSRVKRPIKTVRKLACGERPRQPMRLTNSPFFDTRSRVVEAKVRITNRLGIHARPATLLVKAAQKFESRITLIKDNMEVDGKSIMDIMILAAEPDSSITIRAEGEDEDEAVQALKKIVEDRFYED